MKFLSIEGNTQRLDGGAMFGNAPKALWQKWIQPDESNRIPLACRALLVQTEKGQNILFETGVGAFFEPKLRERYGVCETEHLLLQNLQAKGLKENDIDAVILSHLHFDHAGGILSAYSSSPPKLLFPRARYYVGAEHWGRACQPHIREQVSFISFLPALLKDSNRLIFIAKATHPSLDFEVSFRVSNGHTIGLILALFETAEGPLLFASDLAPGLPWVHAPITMGYDRYPELLVDEKKLLFNELLQQNGRLFLTHDPHTPCVSIHCDDKGKYFGKAATLQYSSNK